MVNPLKFQAFFCFVDLRLAIQMHNSFLKIQDSQLTKNSGFRKGRLKSVNILCHEVLSYAIRWVFISFF